MGTAKADNIKYTPVRTKMEQAYGQLLALLGMEDGNKSRKTSRIIKETIGAFADSCENPALWCYGEHTRMLMTDYVFEMKKVRYIIDEFCAGDGGFEIIRSGEIEEKEIDGIIISSFKYRKEIAETIRNHFPQMRYLDIYQTLHENGIDLVCEYYAEDYPYARYARMNRIRQELREQEDSEEKDRLQEALLREYVAIKDFPGAIACMEEILKGNQGRKNGEVLDCLKNVYELELQAASAVSERNVLMLCIDGLRRRDLFSGEMEKVRDFISRRGYAFTNAYSTSTSTYESLIPTYSGNYDLRTRYYEKSEIEEDECPFIKEAVSQGRKIHFYTDFCHYVKSNQIKVTDSYQTAAEKLWDFLLDAADEDNGLFYVHILYESHYSYPNPYTAGNLVTEGTSILFDFLSRNGGQLKTDYAAQHRDALNYLDDLLAPVLERLSCRIAVFADHGNILLDKDTKLEDVTYPQLTFGEELIQVPLVICDGRTGGGASGKICSLMELNTMITSLLQGKKVTEDSRDHVKVVRSRLYNVDFKYLYTKMGHERGLGAFEAFLFQQGYKLAVYSDGAVELYDSETDERLENESLKEELLARVKEEITVCAQEAIG
nr:sulfatase-like hydrolase/transferase [uncultured Acetatifactor sp.]